MVKSIIFLGPSLDIKKAQSILDADYRPPAKKGDLLKLIRSNAEIVGLVDGYFLQDYPPTPIEVFNLLRKKNIQVFGASSLGALRAVELGKFGMIGIGSIFNLFEKQIINSDDEVAVTFTEYMEYKSEPLIDIRFNLFLAKKKLIITDETKQAILRIAKNTYFPYRTYPDILDKAKMKFPNLMGEINRFEKYLDNNKRSLKEEDAILLLKRIKMLEKTDKS